MQKIKFLICVSFSVKFLIYTSFSVKFLIRTSYHPLGKRWEGLKLGVIKKLFYSGLFAHRVLIDVQIGVFSWWSDRQTDRLTDGKTDGHWFFSMRCSRTYILYRVSDISFDVLHKFCLISLFKINRTLKWSLTVCSR